MPIGNLTKKAQNTKIHRVGEYFFAIKYNR